MSSTEIYQRLRGTLAMDDSGADANDADLQDALQDDIIVLVKPAADAMAADTSTIGSFKAPFRMRVTNVDITPHSTLTANDTNFATVTLGKADGAGGASTAIATVATTTTGSGNWAADVFEALTVTGANATVNDGQIVTLKITKAAAGVVVPACSVTVRFRRV